MDKRFLGAPYPIIKTPLGLLAHQSGTDQIKSDLLILLLTNPGERVFLPTYGTPLRKLIFEPNDSTLQEQARQMIIDSINTWEPRITVSQIDVSTGPSDFEGELNKADSKDEIEHILFIRILFFDPTDIVSVQELSLEVPLAGGQ